jgi:uncharacterized membrane protein YkvA (DUF1232 family)
MFSAKDQTPGWRGMSNSSAKPFTRAEMEAIRAATRDEGRLRLDFWAKLKRVARQIPFAEDLLAAYYCATDAATPKRVKLILLGALAYFILPADAVPDLLPMLGFADDAAMLAAAIAQVAEAIDDRHRAMARRLLNEDAGWTEPA